MKLKILKIPFQIIGFNLFRKYNWPALMPLNVTLSVTNKCNSKCLTCNIWKQPTNNELSIKEWKKTLISIGTSPIFITITGGEPFLKNDIEKIILYICKYNKPLFLNIATNGLWNEIMIKRAKKIIKICQKYNSKLTLNFSIAEIDNEYDKIRGTKNGFIKVLNSIKLVRLTKSKVNVGVNITASKFNIKRFKSIYNYISDKIKPDSIISELATNRKIFFLKNEKITPDLKEYIKILKFLEIQNKTKSKLIFKLREKYYKYISNLIKYKKRLKCYAGVASTEILSDGDIINCCVRANTLGNLREQKFNFKSIWNSKEARKIRSKTKHCACTLSNPFYTNWIINKS
jgi:MoaA/NifB/PqqE/SkfB family radical SAM enzyme